MKKKLLALSVAVPALMLAFSAQAHSEKEHMKTAENPDCTAMSTMDQGDMDMNDPVVMAMMQQCMSDMSSMKHGSAEETETEESESASHGHSSAEAENASHGHDE
ncbi:MAG: hypothetical protein ACJAWL_000511 [Motiliproteus sp.]|jgi:hypothetical protein